MSQAAYGSETTQGFAPPTVTQFSVFLANKVGKLHDLVDAFDHSPCQICALSVHDSSDHAVIRMITNRASVARAVLREQRLPFSEMDVLVVELSKGHTLSSLCLSLLGAELNIHFAYPLMLRPNGTPTIAMAVDDATLAGQILRRKEFRLFGEQDLVAQ
ncbi:MAG: acetolactate synthase [Phycisphaerales bacterium]|nr:acetolactate synthase [Phycisphaerales bacterium]